MRKIPLPRFNYSLLQVIFPFFSVIHETTTVTMGTTVAAAAEYEARAEVEEAAPGDTTSGAEYPYRRPWTGPTTKQVGRRQKRGFFVSNSRRHVCGIYWVATTITSFNKEGNFEEQQGFFA